MEVDSYSSDEDLPRVNVTSHPYRKKSEDLVMILDDEPSTSVGGVAIARMILGGGVQKALDVDVSSVTERMSQKRAEALVRRKVSEEKRRKRETERELAKLIRDQEKEDKKQRSKEHSPVERLKNTVILLDSTLAENGNFMAAFAPAIHDANGSFRVREREDEPGVVKWVRVCTECGVGDTAHTQEVEEKEVLVTMEAQGFVGLVHYSKQKLLGQDLPEGAVTLEQYVEDMYQRYPGANVSLAIEGIEAFLRGHRTRVNRQFRDAVRSAGDSSHAPSKGRKKVPTESMFADVGRVDCEEAMVRLQLGGGCMVRMCEGGEQLAGHVLSLTKAISDSYYQKENPFSFYTESGQGPSKKELAEAGESNKVALIWKHQLMQFNNLSSNIAAAIVAVYPSPAHLLQAYEECSDREEAERLLKDIVIRRGVGVVSSSRKLGPVQSKRIHTMMTSEDPDLVLS